MHITLYICVMHSSRGSVSDVGPTQSTQWEDDMLEGKLVMLEFLTFENIAKVSGLTADEHFILVNHFLTTQVAILQYN